MLISTPRPGFRIPRSVLSLQRWLTLAIAFAGAPALLMAAPPTLDRVEPAGGQRGKTVTVELKGKFDWPISIDSPGLSAAAKEKAGQVELTIPADLPADRSWLRIYNAEGASSRVPFLIGSNPELVEIEPNNAPREAQTLSQSTVTINGVLKKKDVDGFAIDVAAGQTLVAALDANTRMGSPIDAILQVATPEGFVVAENHDAVGLDPRVTYTPAAAGRFIVRVFAFPSNPNSTIAYSGGDDHIYRLTVTTGPYITHAIPMAVPTASPGEVEPAGWNIPEGTRLPVQASGDLGELEPRPEIRSGLVFSPDMAGSARVRLVPDAAVPQLHASTDLRKLTLPATLLGLIAKPRDVHAFEFPLQKGDRVLITAEARSLHFSLDPTLILTDSAGKQVAAFDDPKPDRQPAITYTAPADGEYRLTLRDRHRAAGDESYYQLTVRNEEPDFELSVSSDVVTITAEKPAELTVTVQRKGSGVGPITIALKDPPAGVTCEPVVSEPKGDSSGKVKLKLSATGPAFSGRVQLVGTAKVPRELERTVRTPSRLGATFDTLWLTVIAKP